MLGTYDYRTSSISDLKNLSSFMMTHLECGKLEINSEVDDFYADSRITSLGDGAKFITMEANGYDITHSVLNNNKSLLYLIYSDHNIAWSNLGHGCSLPYKDSFIIDSSSSFYIKSHQWQKTKSFGIPIHMINKYSNKLTDKIIGRRVSTLKFGAEINKIISSSNHYHDLRERLNILSNLISLQSYDDFEQSDYKYDFILKKIKLNIHDETLSLKKLAGLCNMSPRGIQQIIFRRGKRFTTLLAELRLENLCENIDKMKGSKMADIVYSSGYSSLSTASRHFKAKYNDTLSHYILSKNL
ncbi:helix-turn-helix domain-containing protein [Edwardsiella tarda]|uniref:helix-turn-helix domain-containing protein n=1 Tax=Edwardsiella tarda TaxID=636 RepID=UPI003D2F114D